MVSVKCPDGLKHYFLRAFYDFLKMYNSLKIFFIATFKLYVYYSVYGCLYLSHPPILLLQRALLLLVSYNFFSFFFIASAALLYFAATSL